MRVLYLVFRDLMRHLAWLEEILAECHLVSQEERTVSPNPYLKYPTKMTGLQRTAQEEDCIMDCKTHKMSSLPAAHISSLEALSKCPSFEYAKVKR